MSDLISRQAVIYTICDELDKIDHVPQWVYDRLEKALKQLPSAQPETTRRIVGKSKGGMTLWYECEQCREPVDAGDRFCRSCGRRFIKNHGWPYKQTGGA